MTFSGPHNEFLQLSKIDASHTGERLASIQEGLCLFWSINEGNRLKVDGLQRDFPLNQILFLSEFHTVELETVTGIRLIQFNRPFYCIRDHDHEVSCKGLLFYAGTEVPAIQIHPMDEEVFETLWKMFGYEMGTRDNLQYEMLQTLLKRLIILCTRIYKMEHDFTVNTGEIDLFREFNYLVEMNFRELHSVSDYANLLYKSPKTLSNTFARFGQMTPLEIIQGRILLEAKRLLRYSNKPIKTIAYELGFEDVQAYSRFFKRKASLSSSEYRQQILQG